MGKFTYQKILLLFLVFSLISSNVQKDAVYASTSTSAFGKKNEPVYNIDHLQINSSNKQRTFMRFSLKSSKHSSIRSWKDLEGKLITSDGGKVVRLVDSDFNGQVLVNEGPNPFVITAKSSIREATRPTLATSSNQMCTDVDYIDYLVNELGFPRSATIKGKKLNLNASLTRNNRVVIYGNPNDVPDNDYKSGQYEYLGFNRYGGLILNDKYPITQGDAPPVNQFLTTDDFTGSAAAAYAMKNVYTGQSLYSDAADTIQYFSYWGIRLVDRKPASWWLSSSAPRIKLQGIYSDYDAGLGVTQYKSSSGTYWYQTYMIKPKKLPQDCEYVADVKATKLTATRNDSKVSTSFSVANNHPEKKTITAPNNVPWSLTWSFSGYDSKGQKVSKSGSVPNTNALFSKTFKYGTTYTKSYSFSPNLSSSWSGVITLTAKFNPSCPSGFKEANCSNNTATTTLNWTAKPPPVKPPGAATCNWEQPDIEPRYQYEMDFAVTSIQGQTADSNTRITTPVTVYRTDFSARRNAAKAAIDADIKKKEEDKKKKDDELAKLNSDKAALDKKLAEAKKGHPVQTCKVVNGKKTCTTTYVVNPAEVAAAQNAVNAKQTEINKKQCEIEEVKAWITAYNKEKSDLVAQENKYRVTNPSVVLTFEGDEIGRQTVSLQEGQSINLNFNWILMNSGTIQAEINPEANYDETTFENNALETPVYTPSEEMSDCGSSSSVSGVVRTVNTQTINGQQSPKVYYEYLSGNINNVSPSRLRAGYGFTYNAQTNYSNQWEPLKNGTPPSAYARYSYAADAITSQTQFLDKVTDSGNQSVFQPKTVYVAKKSGIVFDSSRPSSPKYDPTDPLLNGGRKWYSDFNQKDGVYPFTVYTSPSGVNHLSLCLNSNVEVKGTAMDDFVRRSVLPENPFPAQSPGWNWMGMESVLTRLKDWFYSNN